MSLDAGERVAKIQGGEEVRFGKALLGTGAMVNILRVDGAELEGIHYLRAFGNSDAIREEAQQAKRAVLIGGSYIGCEVAASLVEMGVECTIVMLEEVALSTGFGEEAGRFFQEVLESKGVEFVGGDVARLVRRRGADSEGRDRGRARDRVRLLRRRRGRAAGRDAGAARRARGRGWDRLRLAACRRRSRGSSPRATAARTTASCTVGGCGSSTGTSRSSRGGTSGRRCSATRSRTRRSRTSSAT